MVVEDGNKDKLLRLASLFTTYNEARYVPVTKEKGGFKYLIDILAKPVVDNTTAHSYGEVKPLVRQPIAARAEGGGQRISKKTRDKAEVLLAIELRNTALCGRGGGLRVGEMECGDGFILDI